MLFLLFFLFFLSNACKYSNHFRAILSVPPTCTLKHEHGLSAFIEGGYKNYPLLIKKSSKQMALEFYDITNTLIEEIDIEGFKKSQIENVLDTRGFYFENPTLLNDDGITDDDFAFVEMN
ncbi:Selenoprotein F/M domain-containing protein [Entamoeba marina]